MGIPNRVRGWIIRCQTRNNRGEVRLYRYEHEKGILLGSRVLLNLIIIFMVVAFDMSMIMKLELRVSLRVILPPELMLY